MSILPLLLLALVILLLNIATWSLAYHEGRRDERIARARRIHHANQILSRRP